MANAYKCDMCGRFYAYNTDQLAFPPMHVRRISENSEVSIFYDLCNDCADKIENLISMRKVKVGLFDEN